MLWACMSLLATFRIFCQIVKRHCSRDIYNKCNNLFKCKTQRNYNQMGTKMKMASVNAHIEIVTKNLRYFEYQ